MQSIFKKAVILDSVIFYPEHRKILNKLVGEVEEYPSSLPRSLEKQLNNNPEMFKNKKCYTQLGADNTPAQLLMDRIDGADVVISCWTSIPDEVLRLNPQIKLVIFWTHEKEHRINMDIAKEMGITVLNVPDYGTRSVAEVTFAGWYELIKRNFSSNKKGSLSSFAVMDKIFTHFRLLGKNESYTRKGKFTHHFHKLGNIDFDFGEKDINELIPERLVENKNVGFLNIALSDDMRNHLNVFSINVESLKADDHTLASFYSFMSRNELVFFDPANISKHAKANMLEMFADKIIDISELQTTNYTIQDKTFGIIGMGRIGQRVALLADRLGFNVVYYSRSKKEKFAGKYAHVELGELVSISDVISLHVPAYKAEGLLTETLIGQIKENTIFLNTADGNALDQRSLTRRLQANDIYAYLDVYPGLPRKDVIGIEMKDKSDWKIKDNLNSHVIAYRAGWKTQESIRTKTYKLLGHMTDYLLNEENE